MLEEAESNPAHIRPLLVDLGLLKTFSHPFPVDSWMFFSSISPTGQKWGDLDAVVYL